MISKKEKVLRKISLRLKKLTGISPNNLSFIRVFLTPWITLSLIEALERDSVTFAITALSLYLIAVLTDLFDGPLARAVQEEGDTKHNVGYGGVLDRVSDKLLIVF